MTIIKASLIQDVVMNPNNVILLSAYRQKLNQYSEIDLSSAIQALIRSLRLNTPCHANTIIKIAQKK